MSLNNENNAPSGFGGFGFVPTHQTQFGFVEAHCQGLNIRWNTTGSVPIGDILEQAMGRINREWSEISQIHFSSNGVLQEWLGGTSIAWRCPVDQLWDDNKTIKFYFTLMVHQSRRVAGFRVNRMWEQKYRDWISMRDRIWSSLNRVPQTTELVQNYLNQYRDETEQTRADRYFYRLRDNNLRRNTIRIPGTTATAPLRDILNIQPIVATHPQEERPGEPTSLLWENILRPMMNAFQENGVTGNTTEFIVNFINTQEEEDDNILTMAEFDRVSPRYVYEGNTDTEPIQCAITQQDIVSGMEVRRLPCGHIFTSQSIEEWITRRNSQCPVCRNRVERPETET